VGDPISQLSYSLSAYEGVRSSLAPFDQLTDDERKDALHALIQTINRCNLSGFGAVSLARRCLLECEKNVRARGAQKMDAVSDIAGGSFGEAAPDIQSAKNGLV
jgi:hypothetical protein